MTKHQYKVCDCKNQRQREANALRRATETEASSEQCLVACCAIDACRFATKSWNR